MAAAPRRWPRHSLLRPDQPRSRLRRRLDDRHRRRSARAASRAARCSGCKLNWHKRYITLGPVATLLGLAFKAYDPDHLLGSEEDLGITVALIPTHLPGVEIGRRHLPAMQVFQNGPNWGRDVFIPLDYIIGGKERLGQGWKMLMTRAGRRPRHLAAVAVGGRRSLLPRAPPAPMPASASSSAFPIGKFEGIEEPLARIAGTAYLIDAARRLTCAALNQGHHPAVISGIMKLHATERMRIAINDAMDIHGGKAVHRRPAELSGQPLSRGAGRHHGGGRQHPHPQSDRVRAGRDPRASLPAGRDERAPRRRPRHGASTRSTRRSGSHVGHSFTTLFRAWGRSWTGGMFAPAPDAGEATGSTASSRAIRRPSRCAADMALLTLGGALKRKEMLSARFGDILSELYLLSAALKRWEDEGRQEADFPRARMVHGDRLQDHREPALRKSSPICRTALSR